jgi:HD superfamily phosphodiesterase
MKHDLESIFTYANNSLKEYDGSHDISHACRVAISCIRNEKNEQLGSMICALLHDTCDPKYVDKQAKLREIRTLLENIFDIDFVDDIIAAMCNISFTRLKNYGEPILTERAYFIWKSVSNADMIEAIGIIGCVRTLMFQGFKCMDFDKAIKYIREELYEKCSKMINVSENEVKSRRKNMKSFIEFALENKEYVSQKIMKAGSEKKKFDSVVIALTSDHAFQKFHNPLLKELSFSMFCGTQSSESE